MQIHTTLQQRNPGKFALGHVDQLSDWSRRGKHLPIAPSLYLNAQYRFHPETIRFAGVDPKIFLINGYSVQRSGRGQLTRLMAKACFVKRISPE
jgi:hypothetical protein